MQVGIIGGNGYTGQELLRLLAGHPDVTIKMVCSRTFAGQKTSSQLPYLRGIVDLEFSQIDINSLKKLDMVFCATPNGVAMEMAPELLETGVRVIDLAADFRLKDSATWEQWYQIPHACPQYLQQAAYGLSEWNRASIESAKLVANPGCYATAMQLALLPFMEYGDALGLENIIVDGKSGVSGAGNSPSPDKLFAQVDSNLSAYKISGHRHTPEVLQQLHQHNKMANITFVPHLIPMTRGMLVTIFIPLKQKNFNADEVLRQCYKDSPFIDIMDSNESPQTKSVAGTNKCRLSATVQNNTLVLCSAIDNLGKGAAGQAVQNFNIMCGLDEQAGLKAIALYP